MRDFESSVRHRQTVDDEFDLMAAGIMATRAEITNSLANSKFCALSGRKVECPELEDFGRCLSAGTRIMDAIIDDQASIVGGGGGQVGIDYDCFAYRTT